MASLIEQLIAQTNGQVPDTIQQQIDILTPEPVDSSWVESVAYDPTIKVLRVELQSGEVYSYYNVPESVYVRMTTGSSPGTVINKVLKQGFYPYSIS